MYREKTWGPGQNPKRTPPFGVEEEEPAKDTEASREVVSEGTKQEEFREVCVRWFERSSGTMLSVH